MDRDRVDFFIGTCVIEGESETLEVARFLKKELAFLEERIRLTYKGSFDKANRTSLDSFRGPGLGEGLRILEKIKGETGLSVITDFHDPSQAESVARVVDTLQIPAFLCRQTDMIASGAKACARYKRRLNIKKGQFLAPWDVEHIANKAKAFLPMENILITERGTSFGYNNLVVDMSSFETMKSMGLQTVHDCTHCVQRPGGLGKTSGGKRESIVTLAKAAAAAGADGFFMECHPDPPKALSDAATSLPLDRVRPLVETLLEIRDVCRKKEQTP
ncbi:MAG: 3-deoxy-8-phosphooctulonate synthase [Bacteriovoracales bacterium]|nr:3-deoxy-8-phosphooctulonate synthase [Bacteriovoracales bacterium]